MKEVILSSQVFLDNNRKLNTGVLIEQLESSASKLKPSMFDALVNERPVQTSIIVPAYNEEAALPLVLSSLIAVIDESYEVIVVDDGSTDQSVSVSVKFPCRVVRHPHNMGKGAALQTGLQQARGKYAIFIDADNTYPVELIPALVECLDGHDLVRGVRQSGRKNIPLLNRMGNLMFDRVIRALHAVEGGDLLSGMYGGRRESLMELSLESRGFDIEAEINVKAHARGMTCATVPITYLERVGDKKLRAFRDGLRILYRLLQLTISYNPLLVFILPGILLFGVGMLGVGYGLTPPDLFGDPAMAAQSSFTLGIIGTIGAQLIIFGLAVYSAGMAYGLRGRANQTLDWIANTFRTRVSRVFGIGMMTTGVVAFFGQVLVNWMGGEASSLNSTTMVLSSLLMLIGMQVLSATAFLSALNGLQSNMYKIKRAREE
jgi:glycosyltransferase involved in cell wall biosynthesis